VPLRDGRLRPAIAAARERVRARGDRYSEVRTAETARARKIEMSYIGG
jgi:cyclic pyranopterin phosphate synthase